MYPKICVVLIILFGTIACKSKDVKGSEPDAATEVIPLETEKSFFVSAKGGLRLRAEPNQGSKTLVIAPQCSRVFQRAQTTKIETIDGLTGHWAKLRYVVEDRRSITGWGFKPYLTEEISQLPVDQSPLKSFKSGCLSITGEDICMAQGCGSIEFSPNGVFRIAYDCHLFGAGTWRIEQDKIKVESSQDFDGCGHFSNPAACMNEPKGPRVFYEFKLGPGNNWLVKTDSKQWKEKSYLQWTKEWNSVGKMQCLIEN